MSELLILIKNMLDSRIENKARVTADGDALIVIYNDVPYRVEVDRL